MNRRLRCSLEEAEGSVVDVREDLGDELAVVINQSFAVSFDF